jgi:hypothetical protein
MRKRGLYVKEILAQYIGLSGDDRATTDASVRGPTAFDVW